MQQTAPEAVTISIHAPREGSDPAMGHRYLLLSEFLSTLPVRGATLLTLRKLYSILYFYPRSP